MTAEPASHDDLPPAGVNTRVILLAAFGTLALIGSAMAILITVLRWQVPNEEPRVPSVFAEPRVLQDESLELQQLRARHRQQLRSYEWVDRDKGIVAIPIERAMELIAKRGADAYAPVPAREGQP